MNRFEKAKYYTEKYKSELLPCRICGNSDIRFWNDWSVFGKKKLMWTIYCMTDKCDCVSAYSIKEAINKWNNQQRGGGGNKDV